MKSHDSLTPARGILTALGLGATIWLLVLLAAALAWAQPS